MLSGFVFDSNRGTRVNITADNPLGSQFQFGWNSKKGKRYKTKSEIAQEKVTAMAAELQTKYFSANQESTRRVAAELRAILSSVETACQVHETDGVRMVFMFVTTLTSHIIPSVCNFDDLYRVFPFL